MLDVAIARSFALSLESFAGHGFSDDDLAATRAFMLAEYFTWK